MGSVQPDPEDLERAQQTMREALIQIDAACTQLGIEYWVDAGTLLGAVRTGGFIPWDDDIDLCMAREDIARFLAEAPALLGPGYTVISRAQDPIIGVDVKVYIEGTHVRTREVSELGIPPTRHDGLFIDILVADQLAMRPTVRRAERAAAWLTDTHPWSGAMAARATGARRIRWLLASLVPTPAIGRLRHWLTTRLSRRQSGVIGIGTAALYNGYGYAQEVVYPLKRIPFEGIQVPAPANTDRYLTHYYGADYLTPPPPDKRTTHCESIWFDTNRT